MVKRFHRVFNCVPFYSQLTQVAEIKFVLHESLILKLSFKELISQAICGPFDSPEFSMGILISYLRMGSLAGISQRTVQVIVKTIFSFR